MFHFNQQSPLDRGKLSAIIKQILDKKPKILAIDLDLSPDMVSKAGDEKLKELLTDTIKNNCETKLVLISPVPVRTRAMFNRKKEWIEDICTPCNEVIFVMPTLLSNQDAVIRYNSEMPTLGVVAAAAKEYPRDPKIRFDLCKFIKGESIGPEAYEIR